MSSKICPSCKATALITDNFCLKCGFDFRTVENQLPKPELPYDKEPITGYMLKRGGGVIWLSVFTLIAAFIYLILLKNEANNKSIDIYTTDSTVPSPTITKVDNNSSVISSEIQQIELPDTFKDPSSTTYNEFEIESPDINEVKIGNQIWMTKNLDVDRFQNGELIPETNTAEEWIQAGKNKQPAWCYYEFDHIKGSQYGKLYNWYAVNDSRGLAPQGWHIPSDSEWDTLTNFLGETTAGKQMKTTRGWLSYMERDGNGTNSSGFSGFPVEPCNDYGEFYNLGTDTYWWSSSFFAKDYGKVWGLRHSNDYVTSGSAPKNHGYTVRCVKD